MTIRPVVFITEPELTRIADMAEILGIISCGSYNNLRKDFK
jgi:hypothetical protein